MTELGLDQKPSGSGKATFIHSTLAISIRQKKLSNNVLRVKFQPLMVLAAWIILSSKEFLFQKGKYQMQECRESMNHLFAQYSTFAEQIQQVRFHLKSSRERKKVINQLIHDECDAGNKRGRQKWKRSD